MKIEVKRQSQAKTRTHILVVAERLFSESGFDVVSIRDITAKARVSLGAINYHFGTKLGLIAAIFDQRLTPVTQARLAALDEVENHADTNGPTVEDILCAFIRPAFGGEGEGQNHTFQKLMGRCLSEPSPEIEELLHAQFQTLAERFDSALLRAQMGLTREEIFWRMNFVIAALHHSLLIVSGAFPLPPGVVIVEESVVERLVAYGSAVFRAPISGKTRTAEST
jgi:AcrR family transcriptional regulator